MINSFIFLLFIYTLIELFYFKVADKYDIIDKPNHRSSHLSVTIRGGGIIFPISFLIPIFFSVYNEWLLVSFALIAISLISFLDDVVTLNNKARLLFQGFSVAILLMLASHHVSALLLFFLVVIITGVINAYNFMDGINGITALYSITTIGTFFWLNQMVVTFFPAIYFISLLASLLVFSYFNIRKTPKCFAGDVGSVSMAFIICFFLVTISVKTGTLIWIFFLGIYGIDTVVTILCRLARNEPIFKAHRSHFYQFLVNERRLNPILVAFIYALGQLLLNIAAIFAYKADRPLVAGGSLFVFLLIYIIFRLRFEGRYRLFTAY